jgi:hypothetical protein
MMYFLNNVKTFKLDNKKLIGNSKIGMLDPELINRRKIANFLLEELNPSDFFICGLQGQEFVSTKFVCICYFLIVSLQD